MATTATNITDARKNLKSLTDDVVDYNEHVIITKPKNRNVVLMSESEFRSWQETLYILGSNENRKALDKSIDQMNSGHLKTLSVEDWRHAVDEN
ncbi:MULTISPECIES: type II toxin-antitoxin system Phd/YefM family antitoxin [Lactobacillaceae]|uniref:type II toxin-antitoxin system Phd/YefM family antitoxin n=1 Tax=Lactobacillaceae TaxID=33958 RepID=UPI0014565BCC|nr:type II toxin-antitoxin system prevent-host-death family antitoxin [Lactobacillus sp. HBUAS51381]NLR09032.1 type II toxin-antitoxin system Phd/YefM family antitoxin [Lactobacillus sp. HBUAS51381]